MASNHYNVMLSAMKLLCALLLAFVPVAAGAQTVTGTIQGTVVDTSDAVLPGATVTITHVETETSRTLVANESGFFSAPYLPIGSYRLVATLPGFGTVTREGITLGLNETRVVNFKLDPRVSAEVTVRGDTPKINLTSGEIKGSLSAEQIMDKPVLNAGSFLSLAETFTGFQDNPTSGQNNPTASSGSSKAVRQRNQYGFTAGFPLIHNKLFAFTNVDRTQSDGENSYTRDVILPSDTAVPWLTRGNDTPENRAWIQSVLDRFPKSLTPNDPRSARTYAGTQNFNFPDADYSTRLDWNLNPHNTFNTRYQWTHQVRESDDVILGEATQQNNKQQNLGTTWTHVFGSRVVGELRYGLGVRSTNVNILAGNDTPIIRFTGLPVSGPIIGNAGQFPINRDQTDHQFVYNLTAQVWRNHGFKACTDIRRQALDDFADNN